jgi:hypothetical protein
MLNSVGKAFASGFIIAFDKLRAGILPHKRNQCYDTFPPLSSEGVSLKFSITTFSKEKKNLFIDLPF